MSDFKKRFLRYIKRAGAGSMLISIILHVFIIGGATVYVVSSVHPQRKALFKGDDSAAASVQHPVKMSNTQPNLDTLTRRISVDTPESAVSLPDLPTNTDSGISSPTLDASLNGAGTGNGSLKGPLMPIFGFKEAQTGGTLVGNFYDFKQLRTGKPNPDYVPDVKKGSTLDGGAGHLAGVEVKNFVDKNFSRSSLYKFFVAPDPLYTTQVFVPSMNADAAPAAFNVDKVAKGKAWMVLYRGKVSPPVTGTYRFVGGADDMLVVRMDGRIVLDGGIHPVTKVEPDAPRYKYPPFSGSGVFPKGFMIGKSMQLRAGQFYDINIAISEAPGGVFNAFILFEQEGVKYDTTSDGSPILPIFRVAPGNTEPSNAAPPFMPNGPIWKALPAPKD